MTTFIMLSGIAFNMRESKILSRNKTLSSSRFTYLEFVTIPALINPEGEALWKKLSEKEKMLVTSISSFSRNIF